MAVEKKVKRTRRLKALWLKETTQKRFLALALVDSEDSEGIMTRLLNRIDKVGMHD